ncbi:hypothetical protein V496_02728 [Pseudogymnoascus sp. VKM F-4515 (FW-2607)]|nr:hypothetical protein V496_02728 [Pseudogymnoascus sp. VKM F-4515 (FW-2607)]KFZ00273.1 hypothetical protein V498_00205 [Pseudogymnoascus sp. VKM F-4517 (FW-2822)]
MQLFIVNSAAVLGLLGLASATAIGSAGARDEAAATAAIASSATSAGSYCCQILKLGMGAKISFPNTTPYNESIGSYFSVQNNAIKPACVVSATTTKDVQEAVGILSTLSLVGKFAGRKCQFAVRSGGHTPWAGSATIQDGVDIDLSALNQVTPSKNKKTVSIGPGNRWIDVYLKLDALGLGVSGGRVGSVGVGGLVTGGGMSFFAPRYGFVCDTVTEFEVVLASGRTVVANAKTNPTLWRALKGGSNNLGVVTRITLETWAQDKFWGGIVVNPVSTAPQQLAAFVNYNGQEKFDEYGALIHSYGYSKSQGGWFVSNNIEYTKAQEYPPVFNEFTSIQPQLLSTMRISNISDFATELGGSTPYGRGQIMYTATYANDLETLTNLFNQAKSSLEPVADVEDLVYSLSLQPLPTQITKWGDAKGGNSLGLHESSGNLVLALISASWLNMSDELAVTAAVLDAFAKSNAFAEEKGTLHSYEYLNYAHKTQTPITGYGAENVAKLKAASHKYDPLQVLQKLVPGGFKL